MRLVLATHNQGKVAELRRILDGLDVELVAATDLDLPEVVEDGETFTANALAKAHAAMTATGLAAVGDDSGLCVDALDGAPGVRSARYAGENRDEDANRRLVLEELLGQALRTGRFVCVAALVAPDGREWTAEGVVEGHLTHEPRGEGGFGYDSIFEPLGSLHTVAEMDPDETNAISHRGQAFGALRPHIAALAAE